MYGESTAHVWLVHNLMNCQGLIVTLVKIWKEKLSYYNVLNFAVNHAVRMHTVIVGSKSANVMLVSEAKTARSMFVMHRGVVNMVIAAVGI